MVYERLHKQLDFVVEIDKMKHIFRHSRLIDGSRYENDAEHSWHLAAMAIVLSEHANGEDLDVTRVLKMLLIHDIVEIDAGDTFAYDKEGHRDKDDRERAAADRIFGILPEDQGRQMHKLWSEFERRQTPEAKFAAALDRLQPLIHNYCTQGEAWQEHDIQFEQVMQRNKHIKEGSESLWEYTLDLMNRAVQQGYLPAGDDYESDVK